MDVCYFVVSVSYQVFTRLFKCEWSVHFLLFSSSFTTWSRSIDYLLIFVSEWMSGDWCAHVTLGLCVCVHACVCVTWSLFDRR